MANSGFKRHFPRVGKCCCCCDAKISVTVCTIIMALYLAFGVFSSGIATAVYGNYPISDTTSFNILGKIDMIIGVCVIISLILLLIGIEKRNFKFMNQFKIVFLVYLIYEIVIVVRSFYLMFFGDYIDQAINAVNETYKQNPQLQQFSEQNEELIRNTVKRSMIFAVIEIIIIMAIIIYYYLSTCSYIEDLEESAKDENDVRNLENNEY